MQLLKRISQTKTTSITHHQIFSQFALLVTIAKVRISFVKIARAFFHFPCRGGRCTCENLELKFTIPCNKSFTSKNLACSYHWQFDFFGCLGWHDFKIFQLLFYVIPYQGEYKRISVTISKNWSTFWPKENFLIW